MFDQVTQEACLYPRRRVYRDGLRDRFNPQDDPQLHHAQAVLAAARTRSATAERDLGWCAGFFDGEGHIGAPNQPYGAYPNGKKRKPSMRLVATISQNDRQVLEQFLNIVKARGKIYATARTVNQNKQCYRLNFDGKHALEVIYLLRPDLRRKQYEADVAEQLAIQGQLGLHPGPHGFSEEIISVRRKLQRKLSRLK